MKTLKIIKKEKFKTIFLLPNQRHVAIPHNISDTASITIMEDQSLQLIVKSKSILEQKTYISKIMTVQSNGDLTGHGKNFLFNSDIPLFEGYYVKGEMHGLFKMYLNPWIKNLDVKHMNYINGSPEGEAITFGNS